MNKRLKLFVTGFLLFIALGVAIFCAVQTVQAFQRLQKDRVMALSGDVRTIRPWMTLPYISRIYRVPESYLAEQLHITNAQEVHRVPLYSLAQRYNRPVNGLIYEVQKAILNFRKQHPTPPHTVSTQRAKAPPSRGRKPA